MSFSAKTLVLAVLLFSSGVKAQVAVDISHDYDLFQTISSNSNHIYTFNQVPKTFDKMELIIYDLEGKKLNRIEFQARRGVSLLSARSMGEKSVFMIDGEQGYELIVLDKAGQEAGRKVLQLEDKIRDISVQTSNHGLTVIYEVKRKKIGVGILIEKLDANLAPVWNYEKFAEKGKYFYSTAQTNQDGTLAVICRQGNKNAYSLCLLDPSGAEKAFVDIDMKGLNQFTPYFLRFLSDTELLLVSDYGSTSNETFKGYPLGMNILKMSTTDGKEISSSSISFIEVQELVGDKKGENNDVPVYQVGPGLRVLDVQTIRGAATLICESYIAGERQHSVPSTTQGMEPTITYFRQMRLMDFYLLNCESPKTAIHRIWKPTRVVEFEAGSLVSSNGLCGLLSRNSLFSYQGIVGDKMLVRGYGQMHHYINLIPLTSSYEPLNKRVFFGYVLNCEPTQKPLQHSYTKGFGSSSLAKDLAREGLLKTGDSYMLFSYDYTSNQLHFSKLNLN